MPVGFVGLGLLGQAMALRLAASDYPLVVWNRESDRCAALARRGAVVAASPREVAQQCDVVCICVLDGAAVQSVVFGPHGVATAGRPLTVVDFSTVEPETTRALAARAAGQGLCWVDAPVSGGPALALEGRLAIMAGGGAADFDAVRPLLEVLSSNVNHVGAVGAGQEMKLINQALVGASFVLMAEALALARARGLDAGSVPRCLEGGVADSAALQRVWPRMAQGAYDPPTGLAGQLLKDLKSVDTARSQVNLKLPLVETALAQYQDHVARHGGHCETVSIARLYERRDAVVRDPFQP